MNVSIGSNHDVYDAAAWAILTQLILTPTKEHGLDAVHRGLCQTFGAEKIGETTNYKIVADEIWRVWRSPR